MSKLFCQNFGNCGNYIESSKAIWFLSSPHCSEECKKHEEARHTCDCGKLREYVQSLDMFACPFCMSEIYFHQPK